MLGPPRARPSWPPAAPITHRPQPQCAVTSNLQCLFPVVHATRPRSAAGNNTIEHATLAPCGIVNPNPQPPTPSKANRILREGAGGVPNSRSLFLYLIRLSLPCCSTQHPCRLTGPPRARSHHPRGVRLPAWPAAPAPRRLVVRTGGSSNRQRSGPRRRRQGRGSGCGGKGGHRSSSRNGVGLTRPGLAAARVWRRRAGPRRE